MAETIVGILLQNVESLIKSELNLLSNAKSEMEKLSDTLTAIQAVLADAETKQNNNEAVEDWLAKLKDVAYDADDTLNEWATDESRHQHLTNNYQVHVSCFCDLKNKSKNARKIKKIRERFDAIAKDKSDLHLSEGGAVAYPARNRETSSVPNEDQIHGRDGDIEDIVKQLIESANNGNGDVSVFPILGMGGIGKTTLAQFVCKDERVIQHFETRIWCYVSRDFDVKRLSKSVLEDITRTPCMLDNLNAIQHEIQEKLKYKRFLLVVDDVWNEKQELWKMFKNSLTSGNKGSSIIITTRLQVVADIAGTAPAHQLSPLSSDDWLSLFQSHALRNMGNQDNPRLVDIGKQVVEECGSLPLTARVLGSSLCKQDERQWELIQKREISSLHEDLRLSYISLSPHARQCFAYCSLFPKKHEMEKEYLIHIWMANGLIPVDERTSLEVAGDGIFNELLSHSMLQGTERDGDGNIVKCKMHDLFHDLGSSILKNHHLRMEESPNIPEKARHLSVIGSSSELSINHLSKSPSLRTLIFISHEIRPKLDDLITHLTLLRTLHLHSVGLSELPSSIGNLKHLRYLNLQSCGLQADIPESICKLKHLQMLNLACNKFRRLPSSIGDLKNLRYLKLSHNKRASLPESIGGLTSLEILEAANCIELEALPDSIGNLEKLRYLNLSYNERIASLPESIGRLTSLEILEAANCIELEALPDSIGNLEKLRYLNLSYNEIIASLPESIGGLTSLETLEAANCGELEGLPSPIRDLKNLRYLKLSHNGRIKSLPDSICNLTSLQALNAMSCGELRALPSYIGDLKNLRYLNLSYNGRITSLPESIGFLESLQILEAANCIELEALPDSIGNLEKLRCLNLSDNGKIKSLPESIGRLKSLHTLKVMHCTGLEALPDSIGNLQSLKHLDTKACWSLEGMPNGIASLTALQTLGYFKVGSEERGFAGIRELQGLNLLGGELEIVGLGHVKSVEDAGGACLMLMISKTKLSKLTLSWADSDDDDEDVITSGSSKKVLEGLQPHPNIKELEIAEYPGAEFPTWMQMGDPLSSFPTLVELILNNLPNLEEWLLDCRVNERLPLLQSLQLLSCSRLNSIPEEICNLASLKSLQIISCPQLASLPHQLSKLTSLERLGILNCSQLRSLPVMGMQGRKSCLRSLNVENCKRLTSQLEGLQHLTALESLILRNCSKLRVSEQDLEHLPALKIREVYESFQETYMDRIYKLMDELDSSEDLPPSLKANAPQQPRGNSEFCYFSDENPDACLIM